MAHTYTASGWKVFPLWPVLNHPDGRQCGCPDRSACKSPGKHPIGRHRGLLLAPQGVHDASDDPAVIDRWWTAVPDANIGLPAHANGLAILDVDPAHGGDRSLMRLKIAMIDRGVGWPAGHRISHRILTQRTGSGGWHYLFEAPPDGIASKKLAFGPDLPGLDTRGRGGYVVASPSLHVAGERYEWVNPFDPLPPWPPLLTRLMEPSTGQAAAVGVKVGPPAAVVRRVQERWPTLERYVAVAVAAELHTLRTATHGGRNDQLNRAGYALGRFVGAGLLDEKVAYSALSEAAANAGLDGAEIPKTVLSGLASGKLRPLARGPRA